MSAAAVWRGINAVAVGRAGLLALALGWGSGALAQDLTAAQCSNAVAAVAGVGALRTGPVALHDGWCETTGVTLRLRGVDGPADLTAERLRLRGSAVPQLASAGTGFAGDTTLEAEVIGLRLPRRPLGGPGTDRADLALLLQWVPGTGELLLRQFNATLPEGGRLAARFRLIRVDLGSLAAMQFSAGAFAVTDLEVEAAGPKLLAALVQPLFPAGRGTPARQAAELAPRIGGLADGLPDAVLPADSRAAVKAVMAALPAPDGRLRLVLSSEQGAGLLRLLSAGRALDLAARGNPPAPADLAVAFDGLRFDIDWAPGQR